MSEDLIALIIYGVVFIITLLVIEGDGRKNKKLIKENKKLRDENNKPSKAQLPCQKVLYDEYNANMRRYTGTAVVEILHNDHLQTPIDEEAVEEVKRNILNSVLKDDKAFLVQSNDDWLSGNRTYRIEFFCSDFND